MASQFYSLRVGNSLDQIILYQKVVEVIQLSVLCMFFNENLLKSLFVNSSLHPTNDRSLWDPVLWTVVKSYTWKLRSSRLLEPRFLPQIYRHDRSVDFTRRYCDHSLITSRQAEGDRLLVSGPKFTGILNVVLGRRFSSQELYFIRFRLLDGLLLIANTLFAIL